MIVNSVITNGFITVQMSRPELETTMGKRSAETLTPKQCCFSISKTMQTTATAHYIELGGGGGSTRGIRKLSLDVLN